MCRTAHASYIQLAGLEMNYLQLIRDHDLQLYALLAYDSPLVVASPPGTSFFHTRLMVGFGGFNTEPPLLLLVFKEFWTWGLSLSLN